MEREPKTASVSSNPAPTRVPAFFVAKEGDEDLEDEEEVDDHPEIPFISAPIQTVSILFRVPRHYY